MSDPFAAVAGLVALITDVKACAKRLDELRATIDAAEKAQAQLAADRAEHERRVAVDTAELAERDGAVRKRHLAATILEREVNERAQRFAADLPPRYPHDPNLFGTITREPHNG
jgi:putative heme degradation protein